MPASIVASDSLLAIDVGGIHTRVILFDVVEGQYRYLASGIAKTTADAPFNDIREGIGIALDQLKETTGRVFVDQDEQLITPMQADGSGVDKVVATMSAGPPIKVVSVGLLEDVSLESAINLATTAYSTICERIWLNDRRKTDERVNAILRVRPDLIVVAGGIDGGASQTVMQLLDVIGLASYLQDESQRPEIFFVGNTELTATVKSTLSMLGSVQFAPNVRPDLEKEQLDAAQAQLAHICRRIRGKQIPGVIELDGWANNQLIPSSMSMGRIIRSLSKVYGSNKGVMGIDVGASATTLAASLSGELTLGVYPEYGIGKNLVSLLNHTTYREISRWFHLDISEQMLSDYLYNKSIFPGKVPISKEELDIEEAISRQVIRLSLECILERIKSQPGKPSDGGLPHFEPILASGSIFTNSAGWSHTLLMLLDGLQPSGITTIVLDLNHLMPALGAAALINPLLVIQSIDTGAFLNLCPVISPVGYAHYGTPILRVKLSFDNGDEKKVDVKMGNIEVLPLLAGQSAQLHLQPLHRFDVGMGGPGRSGRLQVSGGALGVVIDARGRPLRLSKDPARRREMANHWLLQLGAK
jgi:hypothetical protein